MLTIIPELLQPEAIARMRAAIDAAPWVDGRVTAGEQSGRVKHNRQLAQRSPVAREQGDQVLDALAGNALFLSAALPLKIFPPLFNRYEDDEHFGLHVDNAIRRVDGTVTRIRTDLSATLFLSEPEDYEGGELLIETSYGAQPVKLAAGDMVLYPSTSLHEVRAVTGGARVCSFFWMQSMVRDEGQRSLLFDLDQSIQRLGAERGIDDDEVLRLSGVYHNLLRRWADT